MAWAKHLAAQAAERRATRSRSPHDALGARLTPPVATAIQRAETREEGLAILLDVPGVPTPMTRRSDLRRPSRRQALAGALGLGLSIEFLGRKAFAAGDGARRAAS